MTINLTTSTFETAYEKILLRVTSVNPVKYGHSRNFIDGAVTRLSPYISRGVISTRQVYEYMLKEGYQPREMEKFIQELMWRDFFQRVWQVKGDELFNDLKQPQEKVAHHQIPSVIINAATGIEVLDEAIQEFYTTGYLHNHVRMYIAMLSCNVAQAHWLHPARWMYYHLLDADWASNACSWQWVAGAFSSKKYFANQENINRYTKFFQRATYLDVEYSAFEYMNVPEQLRETSVPEFKTTLPEFPFPELNPQLPILIYNTYNLDPMWRKNELVNRVLLFEPSHFEKYPVSQKTIDFIMQLSYNIPEIRIFTGEFSELKSACPEVTFKYKEHPAFKHYSGIQDERDWLVPEVHGMYSSFFAYWKKCEKILFK